MGLRQSKPDVYVLMCSPPYGPDTALASFSSLKKALIHAPQVQYNGPMWVEKFRVDSPGFYESEDEFIVWRNNKS
jgi:hypothetical protein